MCFSFRKTAYNDHKMSVLLQILLSFVKIAERVCLVIFLVVVVAGFFVARYFLRLVGSMTKIFAP